MKYVFAIEVDAFDKVKGIQQNGERPKVIIVKQPELKGVVEKARWNKWINHFIVPALAPFGKILFAHPNGKIKS